MGRVAFVFPGQGAQKAGMGKDFYDNSPAARKVYNTASEVLGFSIEEICFNENNRLDMTEFTQAAILTTSIAMLRELEYRGYCADITAGLSLGEYCALEACKAISFEDAVKVVRQRGILMQEAVPQGIGGMAAVLGLSRAKVTEVMDTIDKASTANFNCPGQIVISGEKKAVDEACQKLKEAGAKRTIPLTVSGPFHSPMLKGAGEKLREVLEPVTIAVPEIPYITNVTARCVTEPGEIKDLLRQQVYSPVKWEQSVETMIAEGVDRFVEIGPGKILTSFIRKIDRNVKTYNVEKWEDLKEWLY